MPYFTMDESYTEYVQGKRKIIIKADSREDVLNGEWEDWDVIKEYDADGETTDTYPHYETLQEEE